ncbi:MAG: hypothetical protein U0694_23485 [Anaerolineae bacterium]
MNAEQIGLLAGFILTLCVFSYVLGDNFLYRLAVYVFVGLAAGYITVITTESVILPWLRSTLMSGDVGNVILGIIPILLAFLLLLKASARFAGLGNLALAFVIGVGTAVAVVGAIAGTLLPIVNSTSSINSGDLLNGVIIFIGVICSLIYFQYLARRLPDGRTQHNIVVRSLGTIGQGFIVVTFGALYAAAIISSLTVFSERISFILAQIIGS